MQTICSYNGHWKLINEVCLKLFECDIFSDNVNANSSMELKSKELFVFMHLIKARESFSTGGLRSGLHRLIYTYYKCSFL